MRNPSKKLAIEIARESVRKQSGGWIGVKDRLPEVGSRVLVFDETNEKFDIWSLEPRESEWCPAGWYDGAGWFRHGDEITHWMPLPEPPEAADGQN